MRRFGRETYALRAELLQGKTYSSYVNKKGQKERIYICPVCKRPKLYVNTHTWKWTCFRCNAGGMLVGRLARSVAKRSENHDLAHGLGFVNDGFSLPPGTTLTRSDREYLQKRGVQEDLANEFSLYRGLEGDYGGVYTHAWEDRIIIPIYEAACPVFCVGRSVRPRDRRPRYLYPKSGSKSNHVFKTFTGQLAWAFLVEGVFDALQLAAHQLPAVAMLGKTLSLAQRKKLLDSVRKGVILCLDADAWSSAVTISERLAPYLLTRTFYLYHGDIGDGKETSIADAARVFERCGV